ncbi:MAG: FHA domain-containing protein [Anaerolineae bacterium]|nr:FHA domain-containing protein [Anaerolineae bacterium]
MRNCPYCGHQNREGTLFCEECGQVLFGDAAEASTATKQLQNVPDELGMKATWGTARFSHESSIIVHLRDATEPIVLQPRQETIFGRLDPNSTVKPDLDLSPHGALEKGVSRLHASIRRGEDTLTLVDLGSVNGTFLNGQRLTPNQPRVLRDGDEIRFGKLVVHVYFK